MPRLLDLYCGAGGCATGYRAAGFDEIVGVDIAPQPNYPFTFVQADALSYPLDGFDVIHASPPCHDHSPATARSRAQTGPKGTADLLDQTLDRLRAADIPFVVENVVSTRPRMTFPGGTVIRLCGSSFGLNVRRHRLFASNLAITGKPCDHASQAPDRFPSLNRGRGAQVLSPVVGVHGRLNYQGEWRARQEAMGIFWMTVPELSQAVPPAYTEWIGRQILGA